MVKDVQPITEWTDLPCFEYTPGIPAIFISDSMEIKDTASNILENVMAQTSSSQLPIIALAIKTRKMPGESPRLQIIQLRTKDKNIVFEVGFKFSIRFKPAY